MYILLLFNRMFPRDTKSIKKEKKRTILFQYKYRQDTVENMCASFLAIECTENRDNLLKIGDEQPTIVSVRQRSM